LTDKGAHLDTRAGVGEEDHLITDEACDTHTWIGGGRRPLSWYWSIIIIIIIITRTFGRRGGSGGGSTKCRRGFNQYHLMIIFGDVSLSL